MCYAIPGRVINIEGNIAIIDYFGEYRDALCNLVEVKIGDYAYAQGGILVDKIDEQDAKETLDFWKDKFFDLKKKDKKISRIKENDKVSGNILAILQKINLNREIKRNEILRLLRADKDEELKLIFQTANNIRQKEHDNSCCIHGIIEFSNYCNNDCFYCGIRKHRKIERYRMNIDEIVSAAKYAVKELGFKALVLQSGEDSWYDDSKLIKIVEEIRKLNILIFLSMGVRSEKTYEKLFNAGARAILLRFETSNKKIFQKIRPLTSFEERINLIKKLKKIGYIIATGFLVGLPGETEKDIINNILLMKSLNAEMYSFGPLIPTKNTPFENEKLIDKKVILKIIAITRFLDKDSNILVTSAFETLDKEGRKEGLLAGANSLMLNLTPDKYKKLYKIYESKAGNFGEITDNIKNAVDLVYSLGRAPTDLGM